MSDPSDNSDAPHSSSSNAPHLTAVAPQYDVCIVGLGPRGVRIAARAIDASMHVAGCDPRAEAVARFNRAEVNGQLMDVIETGLAEGSLRAFAGAARSRAFVITTSPSLRSDGSVDTHPIEDAIEAVIDVVEPGNLIVVDASAPPGTTRRMLADRLEGVGLRAGEDVFVASACVHDSRCVVGGVTPSCTEHAAALYRSVFALPVKATTAEACELVRLAHRTHQEINTAFANELSAVCKHLGVDVWNVLALTRDASPSTLGSPTPGPRDAWARIEPRLLADACQHDTALTRATLDLGAIQPARIVAEIRAAARRFVSPTIACLGLASESDDQLLHSPALRVASLIAQERLGQLIVVDPRLAVSPIPGAPLVSIAKALRAADIVVVLSDHPSFAAAPRELFSRPSVIDTLGVLAQTSATARP